MEIITSKAALTEHINALIESKKVIGFVPTMGALHDGHLQLVKRCVSENDVCVVSVFVNPTQFNDKHDLEVYPRNVEADAQKLAAVGCAILFSPTPEEMYTEEERNTTFEFDFGGLDKVMEGKQRPGHFNGVVQVVSKLFKLVRPTRAYFGEKDFQQLAIIRRMVDLMNFEIEIVGCPIVREESGLALSSRNALLSEAERKTAAKIHAVLAESVQFLSQTSLEELRSAVVNAIDATDGLKTEYYAIVDGKSLRELDNWNQSDDIVGCITVHCGNVRLIDNIRYK
ncbi:MAG: pantoate--beta-alanine ligase [Bacteroidales bacterium]|nr:pantoate--beta-alanine ligase [Bacteroidales bacterium]